MNVEMKQLQTFLVVAREGSFTRASMRLNRSQPGLTLQIQNLERELGFRLFERTTRTVSLTTEGAEFVALAERAVSEFRSAMDGAQRLRGDGRSVLRVGASSYTAEIPERRALLDGFVAEGGPASRNRWSVALDNSRQVTILRELRDGALDVVLVVGQGMERNRYEECLEDGVSVEGAFPLDFEVVATKSKPFTLSVPCESPLAGLDAIAPADLAGLSIVMMDIEHAPDVLSDIRRFLGSAGALVTPLAGSTDLDVAPFAREHRLAAVSTNWFVSSGEEEGDMVSRRIQGWSVDSELAVLRATLQHSPVMDGFVDYVESHICRGPKEDWHLRHGI